MKYCKLPLLVTLALILFSCGTPEERKVKRLLNDTGGTYPTTPLTLQVAESPLDAVKGDFISFSMEAAIMDLPSIEKSFGFSLEDGVICELKSKSSPDYPWIITVSRKDSGSMADISVLARQPFD
jgi:hypothetical protein